MFYKALRSNKVTQSGSVSLRCSNSRTVCTWTGKALNRSAIPNNLPEFWLVTENWIILPNHQANLHTCQGFETNAICDL